MVLRFSRVAAVAVATVVLAAATQALSVGPALGAAAPPPKPGAVPTAAQIPDFARRNATDMWADRITEVAEVPGSGYGDLSLVHDGNRIDLWWKGDLSATAQQQVDLARKAGLDVVVHPASHTTEEFHAAVKKLFASPRLQAAGVRVTAAVATRDVSAIDLEYDSDDPDDASAEPVARRLVSGESGFAIRSAHRGKPNFQMGTCPSGQLYCRQDDSPPWYGGGMLRPGDGVCSAGFAVRRTSGTNNSRMLTAGHCEQSAAFTWTDGAGDPFTTNNTTGPDSRLRYPAIDSLLLHPTSTVNGGVAGAVWTGPYRTNQYAAVTGPTANHAGAFVFTDGGNSGMHTLVVLDATNVAFPCEGGPCQSVVKATAYDPSVDFGGAVGDSGGPVVSDDGTGGYLANGIIMAGDDATSCGVGRVRYPPGCANIEYYISINGILNYYQAQGKPIELMP